MSHYLVVHIPHAHSVIPPEMEAILSPEEILRSLEENKRVTDIHTDRMITEADHYLIFAYARVFCDVERFENDELEKVGQGIFYTKTIDGKFLRDPNPKAEAIAGGLYQRWHDQLTTAIYPALSYSRVVLVDLHSYSDLQADQTGSPARPDICLGVNLHQPVLPPVDAVRAVLERHGYSVEVNAPYVGAMVPKGLDTSPDLTCIMFEVHKRVYLDVEGNLDARRFGRLQMALNEAIHVLKDDA